MKLLERMMVLPDKAISLLLERMMVLQAKAISFIEKVYFLTIRK